MNLIVKLTMPIKDHITCSLMSQLQLAVVFGSSSEHEQTLVRFLQVREVLSHHGWCGIDRLKVLDI